MASSMYTIMGMGMFMFMFIANMGFSEAYCGNSWNTDNTGTTQFMTMSQSCFVSPGKKYGCDFIPELISFDPDSSIDVKKVCDTSFRGNYTNTDFATLINSRFNSYGLSMCKVSVAGGFERHQLRTQCPTVFHSYCKTVGLIKDNAHFLQMNNMCEEAPSVFYGCGDIPFILDMDPDRSEDVKTICDQSKTSHFDNDQLAALVNSKFQKYNLSPCRISVINNLGNIQFRDECPAAYKQFCFS